MIQNARKKTTEIDFAMEKRRKKAARMAIKSWQSAIAEEMKQHELVRIYGMTEMDGDWKMENYLPI